MSNKKNLANALRFLSLDAIQKANSGHPGMPLGMADIAAVLWHDFLQHNPTNPKWPNRDRFVLSNGHGSILLYALLHLTGYEVSLSDLKQFRQLHAKTPGHPEYGVTPGVEITTGPLGQGLASAVGMALAERLLANKFNRNNYQIVNNYTYCFVGDGCLMEGVSHESCSLAGTLGLGKLIVFWDDNKVSLDGPVINCCKENVARRFLAYGWQVIADVDGHEPDAVKQAIISARENMNSPTLICCKTTIGYGSPNFAGLAKCHGGPLGAEEVKLVREKLDWQLSPFEITKDIYAAWDAKKKGLQSEQAWQNNFTQYQQQYPELAAEFLRTIQGNLPADWQAIWHKFISKAQQEKIERANREASRDILAVISSFLPELIGGSADLASSTFTMHKEAKIIKPDCLIGNYLHYGVREFAMACIMNGLSLYGGIIPYGSTFLAFSDYARAAIRLAALMQKQAIYVLTHDSIAVGEDGPTHQPVEHLTALRIMPNVSLWRPADFVETAVAWKMAIEHRNGPTILALSRQKVTGQIRTLTQVQQIRQGGYILKDCQSMAKIILIATGSEVELAIQAAELINKEYSVRVVSMPSVDVFLAQPKSYQEQVLPTHVPKIVIEAGVTSYWQQFIQGNGKAIGIDCYGKSAPSQELYKYFKLTVDTIVQEMYKFLQVKN